MNGQPDLEAQFHATMVELYYDVVDARINYRPSLFLLHVNQDRGLPTAQRYLRNPDVTEGFERLWAAGRLDLTVEHLVLQEPWRQLFTPDELRVAEQRLGLD